MAFAFALLAGFYLLGLGVMAVCIRNAPDGYEDETGFHIAWQNNRPDVADIACIWSCVPGNPARAGG